MNKLEITSHGARRARVRSLIQLGSLVEMSGLLETFCITLGADLQKDPDMKMPISAFYKGLLVLKDIAHSDAAHFELWSYQGLEALKQSKSQKLRGAPRHSKKNELSGTLKVPEAL